jgi:tRNA threonylcarbamoyladenosine biosynthesis protein TsaB
MRILAIDTSTSWCSVALSFDGQIKHRHELIGAGASQHLLPWINELLHSVSAQYQDLDAIAVGIGPGAFTGVRLSVAIAQGLAVGAKRPVIPVASLDAMAMQLVQSNTFQRSSPAADTQFLIALDARMGEVYWARYQVNPMFNQSPKRIGEITLSSPKSINVDDLAYAAGNAFQEYPKILESSPLKDRMDAQLVPNALGILQWAQPLLNTQQMIAVEQLEPLYIRNKVALTTQERHAAAHSTQTGHSVG